MQNTIQNQKIDVMFDTNVFNHILGEQKIIDLISEKLNVFATHIQRDEISKTKDEVRKNNLLSIFQELTTGNAMPTESAVWDVSEWNECKWGKNVVTESGQGIATEQELHLYEEILKELNTKNKSKPNNKEDALIAETAIKNRLVLVTHDKDLFVVVTKRQGAATNIYTLVGAKEYHAVQDE